jgi:hypothetical protein
MMLFQRRSKSDVRLTAQLAIRCISANYCMRWYCKFKGLSQDGVQADFSKNLKFGVCSIVGLNGALAEDKMCTF